MEDCLRLFFAGDFYSQNIEAIHFSDELKQLIHQSDVAYCNFEAPVKTSAHPLAKVGPSLSQTDKAPAFLEENGFNVIGLANNHIADYGNEGIRQTIDSFQKVQLVGAGNFNQAYSLQTKQIGSRKIGFLAFSHYEFGILDNASDKETLGCAWINHPSVDDLIIKSKGEVDFLFVIVHAGVEDIALPLPEWRERYKQFIRLGADAIIGMHPHVPQGWEFVEGKPIFYSLGNFYFDMHSDTPYWNNGLAVVLEYDHSNQGRVRVLSLINKQGDIQIDESVHMNEYLQELCGILQNDRLYMDKINDLSLDLWNTVYEKYLFISTNRLSFKYGLKFFLKRLYGFLFRKKGMPLFLLNLFRCESHRWIIQRALVLNSEKQVLLPKADKS